jgi:hypothetical protein
MRPIRAAWVACAILLALTRSAAAREIAIERFDARLGVDPRGILEVTETIDFRFTGAWNGIIRDIPVDYRTPQGFRYHLELDFLGATDDEGNSLRVESSRARHYRELKIHIPGAVDTIRTVVLRYRVANGIKFFENHDELYWNVTGDEWEMPIARASAHVLLPDAATGLRALAFTGAQGSQEQEADVVIDGPEVRVTMRRPLQFREGLTLVIGWDKGLVRAPSTVSKVLGFLRANWPLVIPLGVFALMFHLWRTRGRDPERQPIAPRYEPPSGLTPAEAGTLLDHSPDMRDITATLVDLAVRGYLVIEEKEEKVLGLFSSSDHVFEMRKPPGEWGDLAAHERELMSALFRDGSRPTVEVSDLRNSFYKSLPVIRDAIFGGLIGRGFYLNRPDRVRKLYLVIGGVLMFLTFHAAGFGSVMTGLAPVAVGLAMFLSGAIVAGFGMVMPARTESGARTVEQVLGFEDFLDRVEADRFERMVRTPELFEKYLPFAMAFGVEKRWFRAFQDIYDRPPEWYRTRSGHPFRPLTFVDDLGRLSSQAATAMASSPRRSGGSGFGGGGSSGGGFGGGGGRGF